MKAKISYLVSHPIQYFSPLFRLMASTPEIDLIVYYCDNPNKGRQIDKGFGKVIEWDIPLLDGYNSIFLKNLSPTSSLDNKFWSLINLDIITRIYKDKSDFLIIHGWGYFTNCLAIIIGWLMGKRVWLRGENPYHQELMKSRWVIKFKKIILQACLFKMVDRFLYIGSQNKDFYRYYGVPEHKLIYAPYCVNNNFFINQASSLIDRWGLRLKFGFPPDTIIVLFSGKFIFKKRPLDLLKAYAKLEQKNIALVMLGEGELRKPMEEFINQNKIDNVFLTGFINQSEISKYYALADIFVLPSGPGETWGLVVNEAMLFGLPILVSDTVGSSVDLVKHGENGFIFEEGNSDELVYYLSMLINNEQLRLQAGRASKERINKFTYSVMIDNMKEYFAVER